MLSILRSWVAFKRDGYTYVFVVIQDAVYRHGIFGVYTTIELAREAAHRAIACDCDGHHDYAIVRCRLNGDSWTMVSFGSGDDDEVEVIRNTRT